MIRICFSLFQDFRYSPITYSEPNYLHIRLNFIFKFNDCSRNDISLNMTVLFFVELSKTQNETTWPLYSGNIKPYLFISFQFNFFGRRNRYEN